MNPELGKCTTVAGPLIPAADRDALRGERDDFALNFDLSIVVGHDPNPIARFSAVRIADVLRARRLRARLRANVERLRRRNLLARARSHRLDPAFPRVGEMMAVPSA